MVAETEDLSQRGVFIRTEELLPIGEITRLRVTLPDQRVLTFSARVTHIRLPAAARKLGRHGGMGLRLLDAGADTDALAAFLEEARKEIASPALPRPTQGAIVHPQADLRGRVARCLSGVGLQVSAFESPLEVLAATASWRPDLVVAAAEMEPMTGVELAHAMTEHKNLMDVPLVLIGDDASDLARLSAYRAGVSDFIPSPFLDEELAIRVSRAITPHGAAPSSLRGDVADVGIGTLLSLFEFERKSGVLLVLRPGELVRAYLYEGNVLRIESGELALSPRARVLRLLDWQDGRFEFSAAPVAVPNEVGVSTTTLLLEHAQRRDEQRAR